MNAIMDNFCCKMSKMKKNIKTGLQLRVQKVMTAGTQGSDFFPKHILCQYINNFAALCLNCFYVFEKLFCSFFNPAISLYIYYDQYEKYGEKIPNFFFPRLVSMEMAAIFDFRALPKVHLTSKPLLQMQ